MNISFCVVIKQLLTCVLQSSQITVFEVEGEKKRNPDALGWTIGNRTVTGELKVDGARRSH